MSFTFGANNTGTNTFGSGGFGATSTSGFGAPATTSAFGAPASTTTTGFGAAAPATSAFSTSTASTGFGAPATTNTFGAPAAGSTGFGTSTTSTFGAPAASTGFSFGGASTAPSFGTTPAASTGFSFGNTSTATSTFGTSTTGTGFSFGASSAPSTTPSLFGAAAPTTTSAPLFGANTTTGGLFGAKSATTNTTTNLFGGAAKPAFGAATTATTGGFFGSQPANNTGAFNANNTTNNNKLTPEQERDIMIWQFLIKSEQAAQDAAANMLSNEDGSRPDNLWQAVALFKKRWDLTSPDCAFRHYFYNVVPAKDVHLYQKPADHDPRAWEEAQKANPDPTIMVPALAIGFEDVIKRIDQQERLSGAHSSKLQEIEEKLKKLQVKDQLATAKKLAEYKKRHMELTQRVLKFIKSVQLLRHKGYSITPEEEVMRTRYESIQDQLQRSEQFHGKLTQLWAQLQLIKESGRKYGQIGGVEGWSSVSQEDQNSVTKILEEQDKGIQHMVEVLQADSKEIESIHDRWRSHPQ